jgi:hypothetical protein
LIANLLDAKSLPQEKILDLVNQLFEISESASVGPADVPNYVKRKIQEKQRIEEEIQKAPEILYYKNVDIQTIEEYKKLEDELIDARKEV